MYDLSILIPARQEMFVSRTVEDILKNKRGKTEVIVGLDGAWADPGIPDHPDVRIVHVSEPRGQRAMTNMLARLSKAKYLAKTDAHCAFDEGFDVKLMEAMQENWTIVPTMRNLHAFDWKCMKCGKRTYQGPTPGTPNGIAKCEDCGNTDNFQRKILWYPKPSPQSIAYCFDPEPHFQYANGQRKKKGYDKGTIIGYDVSISGVTPRLLSPIGSFTVDDPQPSPLTRVISLLTDLAGTHHLFIDSDGSSRWQDVSVDTMGLTPVDSSGGVTPVEVLGVRDKLEVEGVTTTPILTEVVDNGDMLAPTTGNLTNEPSIDESVSHFVIPEIGQVSISGSIMAPLPIPTTGDIIDSDIINQLNGELGGEFIYNEKAGSYHNGSVALTPIYNKFITPTLSLQGSFFMLTRDKYWELGICDEDFGSWGSQGIEVACKTWLSGGKVMCVQTTWYAHMFRTQGGDFSFPYQQHQSKVIEARKHAKNLFSKDKHGNFRWEKQVYPLSWLVEKFWPVDHWTDEALRKLKKNE